MLRLLPMEQNLPQQMMQMLTGGVVAQAIAVAAELGVADRLSAGPKTAVQLAAAVGADEQKLFRILRFLAGLGIFSVDAEGAWSLTPMAELLKTDHPASARAGARMLGRLSATYPHMAENVRSGTCAYSLTFGKPIFEDLADKPEDAAIFDAAMNSFHGGETEAVLQAYSYEGVGTLADIGCGAGAVMMATLQRYPTMRGILFDQKHVLGRTEGIVREAGMEGRCELAAGSFFETIPAGADAYTMRHILHDWPDEQCVKILTNIRRVMPAAGRLLVVEAVVPEGNDFSPAKLGDIIMMIFPDGMERTEAQYRQLFARAGFALHSVTPTETPVSVIEGRPV